MDKANNYVQQEVVDRVEEYINCFMTKWWGEFRDFYNYACQNRKTEIYPLNNGTELMTFIENIEGNVSNYLFPSLEGRLIPMYYSSPNHMYTSFLWMKKLIDDAIPLIGKNKIKGEPLHGTLGILMDLVNRLEEMIDYVLAIFNTNTDFIPLYQMRKFLEQGDVVCYVEIMKSILASVPYHTKKGTLSEGYFHSIIHIFSTLIGLNVHSEDSTNLGRIDMDIELGEKVYIIEFKFDKEDKDLSDEALQQIKVKRYYQKFEGRGKEIFLVGISFSGKERNINQYKHEIIHNV